ncbi:MAG: PEP-CTERM sorting domain-containing protein [Akkermansiaceae bacterium]|nr:PEP-CTERM sorting domain-containing protein [Akkermansiaceae bacterium]
MKTLLTISALAGLSFTTAQAATITWDDGAGNDDWSSGANWDAPEVAPANGDSVILTTTAQSILDYAWTIESGQSLTTTATGFGDELVLQSDSILTLATGGTMDIQFMRPRFSSGGNFVIEAGASLNTDNYGLSAISATITYEADAAGVTTWNNDGQFQMGGDNLVIDLSSYDVSNGKVLTLVDYDLFADLSGQTFGSISIIPTAGGIAGPVDYQYDLGGGNLAIVVFVPEPSSTALLGLGGLALMLRRRRS